MAKIKMMTDSASDVPAELLKELDIEMVSFPIQVGDTEYIDRVTVEPEEFYEILEGEDSIPTHSQITPFYFSELFYKAWKDGYTHVIYVSINSHGSSTYQNANQAANSFFYENRAAKGQMEITVIDSRSYSISYGYAVIQGARMAKEGKKPEEIIAFVKDWMRFSKVLFVPFSLKYAKRSGRVSASAAFMGEALGLKPIMTFHLGESEMLGKVRGEKNVVAGLVELAAEDFQHGAPYAILRSSREDFEEDLIEAATEEFGAEPALISYAGGTIAINAGTEIIGIAYRKQSKENPVDVWEWKWQDPGAPKQRNANGAMGAFKAGEVPEKKEEEQPTVAAMQAKEKKPEAERTLMRGNPKNRRRT